MIDWFLCINFHWTRSSTAAQVLAKASKIIPTMIMGKIVSSKKYEYYEYLTAVLISFGMTMFLLGSTDDKGSEYICIISPMPHSTRELPCDGAVTSNEIG